MGLSIVVPAYNGERFIATTLESVIAQTAEWSELTVVDDGSTDSTVEIVRGFGRRDPRIRIVEQANGGVAAARNRGFREIACSSGRVMFLDHDDVLEPDALAVLSDLLDRNPAAAGAHGLATTVDDIGRPIADPDLEALQRNRRAIRNGMVTITAPTEPTTFGVIAFQNCIQTPGQVLLRYEALAEAGSVAGSAGEHGSAPFDPRAIPCDDSDLYMRLLARHDFAFAPRPVVRWRSHGANASADIARMWAADSAARTRLAESPWLSEEQRRLMAMRPRLFARYKALEECRAWLTWSGGNAQRGRVALAARQLAHAARSYGRYVSMGLRG